MSKQTFHQNIVGRKIKNDPNRHWNERAQLKHYGLQGETATVNGAWIQDGGVKIIATDERGASAEVFFIHFLLID